MKKENGREQKDKQHTKFICLEIESYDEFDNVDQTKLQ